MLITVLVPSHRGPTQLKKIERMFAQQQHAEKRLVVIENGPAIGECVSCGIKTTAALSSDQSKSDALNTGLDWLRKNDGGAWCCWDDDDYYGPGYLTEIADALPSCDVLGKVNIHVRRSDGSLWLINRIGFPLGHSISSWSDCKNFQAVQQWGEDERFLQDMLSSGAKLGNTSSYHFVWQRLNDGHDHAWPATDNQLAQLLTFSNRDQSSIIDYGVVSSYDFVDRLADPPSGRIITLPEFDPMDHPGMPKHFKDLWNS